MAERGTVTAKWISRFVCCDFMDSWAAWDTWEEADQQRRWWEESEADGHKRVGLVYEVAEPQRQGHHDGHEPLPAQAPPTHVHSAESCDEPGCSWHTPDSGSTMGRCHHGFKPADHCPECILDGSIPDPDDA